MSFRTTSACSFVTMIFLGINPHNELCFRFIGLETSDTIIWLNLVRPHSLVPVINHLTVRPSTMGLPGKRTRLCADSLFGIWASATCLAGQIGLATRRGRLGHG